MVEGGGSGVEFIEVLVVAVLAVVRVVELVWVVIQQLAEEGWFGFCFGDSDEEVILLV